MTKSYNNITHMPQQKYGSMWEISCCLENTFTLTVYMEAVSGTILQLEAYQVGLEAFDGLISPQPECPYWNRPDEIADRFAKEYLCLSETDWSFPEGTIEYFSYSLDRSERMIQMAELLGPSPYGDEGIMAIIDFSMESPWSSLRIRTY